MGLGCCVAGLIGHWAGLMGIGLRFVYGSLDWGSGLGWLAGRKGHHRVTITQTYHAPSSVAFTTGVGCGGVVCAYEYYLCRIWVYYCPVCSLPAPHHPVLHRRGGDTAWEGVVCGMLHVILSGLWKNVIGCSANPLLKDIISPEGIRMNGGHIRAVGDLEGQHVCCVVWTGSVAA